MINRLHPVPIHRRHTRPALHRQLHQIIVPLRRRKMQRCCTTSTALTQTHTVARAVRRSRSSPTALRNAAASNPAGHPLQHQPHAAAAPARSSIIAASRAVVPHTGSAASTSVRQQLGQHRTCAPRGDISQGRAAIAIGCCAQRRRVQLECVGTGRYVLARSGRAIRERGGPRSEG